jgi:hypothetical protein
MFLAGARLADMSEVKKVQRQIERALAFVHAALDDDNALGVAQARANAERLLPRVASLSPLPLSEARQLYEHVSQLRAVLKVLERRSPARN